ncbi:MAG TPA: PEP-CTERM sorting domain-containing protein [Armatimonadota bacterium]|nr:PEP-CTERM sorting domain-containing protein [Armatimonadota bacterium]
MTARRARLLWVLPCALLSVTGVFASPYATEIVSYTGPFGPSPYDDPYALLGKPSTKFWDSWSKKESRVKLVESAYNTDRSGNKLITTVNQGASITVKFDHWIVDDPLNWYGLDFLVFGNAFFTGSGWVQGDSTNMNTYMLTGGGWYEPLTISVSPDGIDWYTYESGPYGDTMFPTNAYAWDRASASWTDQELDFTKPVNPAYASILNSGGISAADAIDLYEGSAGGTGFDLAESGFSQIQYIRVDGLSGFAGGEIDGFSDVRATPEPATACLLLSAGAGMVWRRRHRRANT